MKARQQAAWASGDFAQIATLIVPVAGHLSDAADLRAGSTVLDVACGTGNAALTAAPAERLDFDLLVSDVEEIPFPDHQFDAAVSVLGSVFAPDQRRAAAELVRVTRPGGTTALARWMSDGFIGAMFGTVAKHVPPPAGVASPMLWATERAPRPTLRGRRDMGSSPRHVHVPLHLREGVRRVLRGLLRTTLKALEAAGSARDALERDLDKLALTWNRLEQPRPDRRARHLPRVGGSASLMLELRHLADV